MPLLLVALSSKDATNVAPSPQELQGADAALRRRLLTKKRRALASRTTAPPVQGGAAALVTESIPKQVLGVELLTPTKSFALHPLGDTVFIPPDSVQTTLNILY